MVLYGHKNCFSWNWMIFTRSIPAIPIIFHSAYLWYNNISCVCLSQWALLPLWTGWQSQRLHLWSTLSSVEVRASATVDGHTNRHWGTRTSLSHEKKLCPNRLRKLLWLELKWVMNLSYLLLFLPLVEVWLHKRKCKECWGESHTMKKGNLWSLQVDK